MKIPAGSPFAAGSVARGDIGRDARFAGVRRRSRRPGAYAQRIQRAV